MKQYIDFYNAQKEVIAANSSSLLNAARDAALAVVENSTLPHKGDENYEISGLDTVFAPDYGLNIKRLDFHTDINDTFRCDVPNLSTCLYLSVNDCFKKSDKSTCQLPNGVIIDSLRNASEKHPKLVARHYGKIARQDEPQVALNTLFAQDGLFVYIPDDVKLERPVQVVNIINASMPMMLNRRVLVILGNNAEAKLLLCDHTQNNTLDFLNNQVIEVYAGENSMLDIYDLEESSERTHRVSSMWIDQQNGSNVLINGMTLLNGYTRNNYNIEVNGEHCETYLLGMAICNDNQIIDNHSYIGHNRSHCHSNELFKYVLDDNSCGAFTGKILVKQGADKVEAYQSNKNILASDSAKVHTKPQLEIYNDDVRCSHGATTGQLDKNALFYMQARGISLQEARTLLMQAFMSEVVSQVRLEALRDRLRHLVEKRFYGELSMCSECNGSCHDKIKQN